MSSRKEDLAEASKHLAACDPVMKRVIRRVGPCRLRRRRNHFAMLVRSVVSQQISTAAARTIQGRLEDRLAPAKITSESIAALKLPQLRSVGLSRQKAGYLRDLAKRTNEGQLQFSRFSKMSDENIIEELVQVKGIGRWTAEMLLIFSLGRLDILPCEDLGVRKAIRNLYELKEMPNRNECEEIGQPWHPYASIASWYCWRSLENNG
jgi:DNA-3-methyladenine glycosylase II